LPFPHEGFDEPTPNATFLLFALWITFGLGLKPKQNQAMDVARMFEDLEASMPNSGHREVSPSDVLGECSSVSVSIGKRVFRLQRPVFASDFLLGQHESRTFAVNYRRMGEARLHAAGQTASKNSKIKLHQWVNNLPPRLVVSLTLLSGERLVRATILACDKTFIVVRPADSELESGAVPLAAVLCLEIDAVDNKVHP
jgi:hypothetical protein